MNKAIIVKDLSKTINRLEILKKINLEVNRGEICGIVGRNGSGKSILFKVLSGLMSPTTGSVTIFDNEVGVNYRTAQDTGILIEQPGFLANYSAFKNLHILAKLNNNIDCREIADTLRLVGLNPDDKRPVIKYSLGMRQKLAIAQAIFGRPKLLLLDEPSNNLDAESVREIQELLKTFNKKYQTTILLASHQQSDIKTLCGRIFKIENGIIGDEL